MRTTEPQRAPTRGAATFLWLLLFMASQAHGAIIGFEGIAPSGSSTGTVTPFAEAGFTLSASDDQNAIFSRTDPASNHQGNATDFFGWCGPCAPQIAITLTAANGATFDLLKLDATTLEPDSIVDPVALRVVGHSGANTFTAVFVMNTTWTTFNLSGFANLDSAQFFADGAVAPRNLGIDNISAVPTPEPGTLALVALGLGSLATRRWRGAR